MYMQYWIAGTLLLSAGSARAEHDHSVEHGGASAFGAGVTMVAASFDTMFYSGNYQGLEPALHWSNERFGAGINVALYRLEENGAQFYGFGDVVAHGQARLVGGHQLSAGVVAGVSLPSGDERHGLGMGHPMAMPALYVASTLDRVGLSATAGYSRAIGGDTDHDHGMWPIVEPMNLSELTWSAAGDYAFTPGVHGGARLSGGVPIGNGDHRAIGALRVAWASGRFTTAAELQAGLVGDPFILRGIVSTGMTF
jgi:hypothetical protein